VGKSSLINCILDEERVIVDDAPGTTRDSIDIPIRRDKHLLLLVDTAGLRHKKKIKEPVEIFSLARTKESVRRSDIVFVMIESTSGLTKDDKDVLEYSLKQGKGCVLLVNKWDLMDGVDTGDAIDSLRRRFFPINWIPVVFVSCLEKTNIIKAIDIAFKVLNDSKKIIETPKLNKLLASLQKAKPHPVFKKMRPRILYATQAGVSPPRFLFFCNNPKAVKAGYLRFLEKNIRMHFGFNGVPLFFQLRERT
jgi:GTP-binding protein